MMKAHRSRKGVFAGLILGMACVFGAFRYREVWNDKSQSPKVTFLGYKTNAKGVFAEFSITNTTRSWIQYQPIDNLVDPRRFGGPPTMLPPKMGLKTAWRVYAKRSDAILGVWCARVKKDPISIIKVARDWLKPGKMDWPMWWQHMKSEEKGYAVWAGTPQKSEREVALVAPCVALEFLLDPDTRDYHSYRNFQRRRTSKTFTDSAIFYSLWRVFDTLERPRVAALLNEKQRSAYREFCSQMDSLPWKTHSNYKHYKELIHDDDLAKLVRPGRVLYEALRGTISEPSDPSNEDSAAAPL